MVTRIISLFFISLLMNVPAQSLRFDTLLKDKISIRAIRIWRGKVYYAGTDSKFGYVSLKDSANRRQIRLSDKNLQFRTLSDDRENFFAVNVESPAYFFSIHKKTLQPHILFIDNEKHAFYDALHFTGKEFFAFSDPEEDLKLKLVRLQKSGQNYIKTDISQSSQPRLQKGEAAFAASNSNISSSGNLVWLATGGAAARIFRLDKRKDQIEVYATPFVQGSPARGIYSIDFYDRDFGVAVGGDYTRQQENINNIATTNDGGKSWQIQASGKNAGYKTCVKIRPGSGGRDIIAVGDQNIELSRDFGKTWRSISNEKNLYVCEWTGTRSLVFAGKDKILKAYLADE